MTSRDNSLVDPELQIRPASIEDLQQLVTLEETCFELDRISQRQFRYLLTRANATILVAELNEQVVADLVILYSRATSVARIYSIAVDPGQRRLQLGRKLMLAAESEAWEHHRAYLRAEVRKDNTASLALFQSLGYHRFGEWQDYYEDHMDAWRLEKTLNPGVTVNLRRVPYYEQTLEFTCGPAALIMAMKALQPTLPVDRKLELRLWREATTIFMTSGHGGCGPYGLALAASSRGFGVEVFVNDTGTHLVDTVRNSEKREVIRLVQEDMQEQLDERGVAINPSSLSTEQLLERFDRGDMALVLISSWLIYGERIPHWVVVTGHDEHFIYVHDPYIDYDKGESQVDAINMPIPRNQFTRMSRYGKTRLQAALVLEKRRRTGRKKDS